jgi:type IV secretion system protein VirB3
MFLGVPYLPFFIGAGTCLLMSMYFNLYFLLLIPVVILIMRQMARRDELIFRLLGLRLQFRARIKNIKQNDGMCLFTPNSYREKSTKQ